MTETTNEQIGVAAYDASQEGEFVQIAFLKAPLRSFYLTREEALQLAERIKLKARALPAEKPRPKDAPSSE